MTPSPGQFQPAASAQLAFLLVGGRDLLLFGCWKANEHRNQINVKKTLAFFCINFF